MIILSIKYDHVSSMSVSKAEFLLPSVKSSTQEEEVSFANALPELALAVVSAATYSFF